MRDYSRVKEKGVLVLRIGRRPADPEQILDKDATAAAAALNPWVIDFNAKARQAWTASGGQLITLPPDEQAAMLKSLASVGAEVVPLRDTAG